MDRLARGLVLMPLALAACRPSPYYPVVTHLTDSGATDDGDPTLALLTVEPTYAGHAAWTSYVLNQTPALGPDLQPDQDCLGTELGPWQCIHGGEKRKVVLPDETSCSELAATDDLGAFGWRCQEQAGSVTFFSTALKPDKRLADLLAADGQSFRVNAVRVTRSGTPLFVTTSTVWWTNPVLVLDGSGGVLAAPGTVYVVTATPVSASGYNLDADHVTLVVMPGAVLSLTLAAYNTELDQTLSTTDQGEPSSAGASAAIVSAGHQKFLWLEGDFDGRMMATHGLAFVDSQFCRLRQVRVQNTREAVYLKMTTSFRLDDVVLGNVAGTDAAAAYGLRLVGARYNVIHGLSVSNSQAAKSLRSDGAGLRLHRAGVAGADVTTSRNILTRVLVSNAFDYGLLSGSGAGSNTFSHVTIANAGWAGADISWSDNTTVNQLLVANAICHGLTVEASTGVKLSQIVLDSRADACTSPSGLFLSFAADTAPTLATAVSTSHNLVLASSPASCLALDRGATDPVACDSGLWSTAHLVSAATVFQSSTFVGKVTTDDAASATDANGTQSYADLLDWTHFDSPLRGWGQDGGIFPAADQRERCDSGTCRLWDWRLTAGDTALRERSGNGTAANSAFVSGAACPAPAQGDVTLDDALGNVFLVNAEELMADGRGDDDGLCESDEACVYSPSFGAFQGEGGLSATPCLFTDGVTVHAVTLFGYLATGH